MVSVYQCIPFFFDGLSSSIKTARPLGDIEGSDSKRMELCHIGESLPSPKTKRLGFIGFDGDGCGREFKIDSI